MPGFYLGFIVGGKSPEWPEGIELPRGVPGQAAPEII